jgi:TatD DNase family protein
LTGPAVYDQVDSILERAVQSQIKAIINICTDPLSLERGIQLSKQYPWVYQAAATTPHDVEKEGEQVFDIMAGGAKSGLLKAIGETGLDYFYAHSDRTIQKNFLRRYLQLALECNLPVIIHCREAFEDLFEILDSDYRSGGGYAPGVLHCFTGTIHEAEGVLKRGWMLSFSGIVTFKKSIELQEIAREAPLEQLLIETDTPYLAPQKHRGKSNEPAFIVETASFIASLKEISFEELAQATASNAVRFFHLE